MIKYLLYILIGAGLALANETGFVAQFKYQEDWIEQRSSPTPKEYIRYLKVKLGFDLMAWKSGGIFVGLNLAKNANLPADVYEGELKFDSATVSETFWGLFEIYQQIHYKDLLYYRFGAGPAIMSYSVNKSSISHGSDSLFNEETGFGHFLSFEVQIKAFPNKRIYPTIGMELYRPWCDFESGDTYKQSRSFHIITYGFTAKF